MGVGAGIDDDNVMPLEASGPRRHDRLFDKGYSGRPATRTKEEEQSGTFWIAGVARRFSCSGVKVCCQSSGLFGRHYLITLAVMTACRCRASNRYGDLAHDETLLDEDQHDQREDDRQGTVVRHAALVVRPPLLPSSSSWLLRWKMRYLCISNKSEERLARNSYFLRKMRPAGA